MKTFSMAACTGNSGQYLTPHTCRFTRFNTLLKHFTLTIFTSTLLGLSLSAQSPRSGKKEDADVHYFQVKSIELPLPEHRITLAHISSICVIDARADSSRIGCMQKRVVDPFSNVLNNSRKKQTEQRVNKKPTFLRVSNGVAAAACDFVRNSISFSAPDSMPGILMVIKKLWLSDELNLNNAEPASEKKLLRANRDNWTSGIDVKIEFYLQDKGGYYPLYRYDTIISKAMTISEYGPEFLALALEASLQKMEQADGRLAAIKKRHCFSLQDINKHNSSEYDVPVLKGEAMQKGLYRTFDEFKNNKPSQTNFVLRKDKLTDIVYVKQADGSEYPARDIWGYCNGSNTYVKAGDNFFLLQRMENAFYVFGAKNLQWNEGGQYPVASVSAGNAGYANLYYKNSRWELQLKPFQLDWNSGLLY